ncbi:helix-turn-helix transcriptional regulator [Bacillus sp. BGMRC 2118]|nr:helix-turn-helix transcriptional regulator [Bacillus sp. BGMRC 2118]
MVSKGDHHMKNKEEFKVRLGQLLRRRREDFGYTQESIAYEIGIDPNSYGEIERGISSPSAITLYKIHLRTGISIDKLFRELQQEYPLPEDEE